MANATMEKFGYPATLVREFEQWVVLLRPSQVTLGSLVLAAKSDATAFGALPRAAYTELANVTARVETMLSDAIGYDRINYLMLMMVDPHVHFHVFPRYEGARSFESVTIGDAGWPGPPELKSGQEIPAPTFERLRLQLSEI
jgi:diadenosine tetraphosphate (Ap4A) HIT family hydrolase